MPRKPGLRTQATKIATRVENEFVVMNSGRDEHGQWLWLQLDTPYDYDGVAAMPKVLAYDGLRWKRMGWNSDNGHVYYREEISTKGLARRVEEKTRACKPYVFKTRPAPPHNCDDHAVPYKSEGALGHGWECGLCGKFLQAG